MTWIFTALGFIIIGVGLRDVFHTLLHPSGQGGLTKAAMNSTWKIFKPLGLKAVSLAGPLGIVAVIVLWAALQVLGWALVYYPHVPQGFTYSDGITPSRYPDFIEALYVSTVTLSTLGFGDVIATDPWIRALSPVEALIGFALLTAAVSWFLQLYPALARRRALALRLTVLRDAMYLQHLSEFTPETTSRVLDSITDGIIQTRVDLTQTSESYYFRESTAAASLATSLSYAVALSKLAKDLTNPEVRASGLALHNSLQDLSALMGNTLGIKGLSTDDTFRSYASDHKYDYQP
ncbi:potassium channel family protein [Arthrobacter sp. B1805]|uniref:potassium channel family protein n=1 Tax=Arthrobacter sp. B1805 TaxID=2058892 RepID=UPI000CE3FEE9|nr:potassium channel family protein [Arthrobacter sp. B1805]